MTKKTVIIEELKAYFDSKGGFMEMNEYKDAEDAPIRFQNIKRVFGSWNRLRAMLGYKEVEKATVAVSQSEQTPEPTPTPPPAPEPVHAPEPVQEPAPVEEPAPVQEQPAPVAAKPAAKK